MRNLVADTGLRSTLANRVAAPNGAVGIVAGRIDCKGREVVPCGRLAKNAAGAVDAHTLFEIGSITKVFTSLLLADMVERNQIALDTPVQDLLPGGVRVPGRDGRRITVLDLSMQISGLPRMPSNFRPRDAANPYADYRPSDLFEFLGGYSLPRAIGERYEYSNVGAGLLGLALARSAGTSYEQLLKRRIFDPLGMPNTTIALDADQRRRLAAPHASSTRPARNWDFDALAGAGAIRSTAEDMLTFLAANLELSDSPLKSAMRRMRSLRRETGMPNVQIMMGWHVLQSGGANIIWHNGQTGGYHAFIGFDPARKTGAVVLCNTAIDIDDIGLQAILKACSSSSAC